MKQSRNRKAPAGARTVGRRRSRPKPGDLPSRADRFYLARHEDRLHWILGSSRSGSTWLLQMLTAIRGVVPLDDPHIGHHLGVWRPIALAWAAGGDHLPELKRLDEIKRDKDDYFFSDRYRDVWFPALQRMILTRFEAHVRTEADPDLSEPVLLVKEPGSHAADLLLSMFPASGLIFLLRDGRDVVDSWLDAYQHGSWAQEEGAFPVAPEGRLAFVRWQASVWTYRTLTVQRAYEGHPASRRVIVRYEDLLADPAAQLGRICSTLGIEATSERLAEIVGQHSYGRVPERSKGSGKVVRAARPGGWRENMTRAEKDAMLEIMGPKLDELGYLEPSERRRLSSASLRGRPRAA
jgi:Sulfotransferase family